MRKAQLENRLTVVDDGQDDTDTDGVLFWINKTGFPITDHVWYRMFDHAAKLHPEGSSAINVIKNIQNPAAVTVPKPPTNGASSPAVSAEKRVEIVQKYMLELQYNHTGTQFFEIKKYKSLNSQSEVAREMIKESLPIKCLEAVILGIYLTNGVPGLERYSLSFRSIFNSNTHRHVVLAVSCNGLYGALGMSRREDLMYKPIKFSSLADLVIDYIESYNQYWHKVDKVKIGFPVSHDPHSHEPIPWKGLVVNPAKMTKDELRVAVNKHAKDIRMWVRQAPLGCTYAPRPPVSSSNYPSTSTYTMKTRSSSISNLESSSSVTTSRDRSNSDLQSRPKATTPATNQKHSTDSVSSEKVASDSFQIRI